MLAPWGVGAEASVASRSGDSPRGEPARVRAGDTASTLLQLVDTGKTNSRAIISRHSLTRRCNVLNWPGANLPGCFSSSRSNSDFAVISGAPCNQSKMSVHTAENGSSRVRQYLSFAGAFLCVGRTSPRRHSSGSSDRNSSKLCRLGPLLISPALNAASAACPCRIRYNSATGSS